MFSKWRLSKKERQYRMKIIQELHLNKDRQASLDRTIILRLYPSYKSCYIASVVRPRMFAKATEKIHAITDELSEMNKTIGNLYYSLYIFSEEVLKKHVDL